ncbi:MAG TPA: hypothetical protein VEI01_22720, partial [Terriglobales bacterium]|nr:hypothetical protein [Terriglobales bacterium]
MGSSKTYARWLSGFVLVLLAWGIAHAQSAVPVEIASVLDGISMGGSSAPQTNSSPQEAQQDA